MNTTNLKCWLPFDTSATLDNCGNTWTTSGSPSIVNQSLYLNGSSYLKLDGKFNFTGQDFTISTKFSATSNTAGGSVCLWQLFYSDNYRIHFSIDTGGILNLYVAHGNSSSNMVSTPSSVLDGNMHHAECDYSNGVWYLFLDGVLVNTVNYSSYPNRDFDLYVGTNYSTGRKFTGYLSQFAFYDGTALHTSNFTPPTAADYSIIDFDACFDTKRKITGNYNYTQWVQPILTSNDGNSALIVSSGGGADFTAYKAFDSSVSSYVNALNDGAWIQFVTDVAIEIRGITIDSDDGYLPRSGILQVSYDDGVTWVDVGTWTDTLGTSRTADISFDDGYPVGKYFRLKSTGRSFAYPNKNADISNVAITAFVLGEHSDDFTFDFDTNRKVSNFVTVDFDTKRHVDAVMDIDISFDSQRQVVSSFDSTFDTRRKVKTNFEVDFDTYRQVNRSLDLKCDTLRQIPHNVTITPVDNGLPINTPQTDGIQSIEINISAGSLVDQLTVVTVNNIDILDAVRGQYLDYVYDYRVESFSKRGILSTCKCCSSLDNLLFTQIAYKLQKITWNGGLYTKDSDDNSQTSHPMLVGDFTITPDTEVQKKTVSAKEHVKATASRLKLTPVMLFDDFQSTVDIEQEGVTYQDILNEVFDWSNRVPHKQINCYIRGNYLYVVERGHEQFTYDLDSAHVGKDFTVQRQLIRTSFGVTRKTSDLEKNAGVSKNGWWEPVLGNEIPEEEPEEPEEETPPRNLPSHVQTKNGNVTTDIWYTYDSDGNILTTLTETTGGDIDTRVLVSNSYTTRNGEKLLKSERTEEYERQDGGSFEKVNDKLVNHTYTTVGQQHVSSVDKDGSVNGSVTTPARRDDRPTAYDDAMNNRYLQGTLFEGAYYVERDGHIFVGGVNTDIALYTYENGRKIEVVGFIYHPNEYEYESGTLEQVLLYDSSFPVNDAKAQSITNALKWLNRKIQETVTLDVYDQLHVFDLNDKIIFLGNTYFLQSNTVTKTPNIVNKQSLTLVRWY